MNKKNLSVMLAKKDESPKMSKSSQNCQKDTVMALYAV